MVSGGRLYRVEGQNGKGLVELAFGELLPNLVDGLLGRKLLLLLLCFVVIVIVTSGLSARPTRVVRLLR
jgi:hypothetical protein